MLTRSIEEYVLLTELTKEKRGGGGIFYGQ